MKTGKGDYCENNASHGARILERINPHLVRQAAPNCERLFATVLKQLS